MTGPKTLLTALIGIYLLATAGSPAVFAAVAAAWTKAEMGEPGDAEAKLLKLDLLPDGQKYPAHFNCNDKSSPCHFQLAYFPGDGFDLEKKQRRNILYIPGGPGAIVDSPTSNRSTAKRIGAVGSTRAAADGEGDAPAANRGVTT